MSLEEKDFIIFLLTLVLIFSLEDVNGAKRKIHDYVIKCSLSASTEIDGACARSNAKIFRAKLAQGIPEFHIPPMEPLFVENVVLALPNIRAEYDNCSFTGSTNFDLLNGTFDYKKLIITLNVCFHLIHLDASYHISGKLLILQLESHGRAALEASNIDVFIEMHAKLRKEHGKKYMDFSDRSQQKIKITFNKKPNVYFENLFPGNEELTKTTNAIINDNVIEILTDFMPILEEVISTYVFNIVQTTFDLFSVDELFLP